jgi:RNA polymerase-associated protein RTF1
MDMDLESEEGEGADMSKPPNPKAAGGTKSKPSASARSAAKGVANPYPLEGKYLNEDDRDECVSRYWSWGRAELTDSLDALPEIEREAILAGRQEEMQKYKDSQQLDAMYRLAGMAGEDEESEEEPSRKKRKLPSQAVIRAQRWRS